jgi:hypothetical protein
MYFSYQLISWNHNATCAHVVQPCYAMSVQHVYLQKGRNGIIPCFLGGEKNNSQLFPEALLVS